MCREILINHGEYSLYEILYDVTQINLKVIYNRCFDSLLDNHRHRVEIYCSIKSDTCLVCINWSHYLVCVSVGIDS